MKAAARAPGLLIAAPRSGAGKTTLTLGALRALTRRGLRAQPAKCGPDYIDPQFHQAATGRLSLNLDGWAMRPALIDTLVDHLARDADLIVCEALMGLFDGISMAAPGGNGSSANIAARSGWPVILVVDVSGQSESVGATVKGFAGFDPGIEIAGVVLNRVGSERHRALCAGAIEAQGIPVVGALPRKADIELPERHLGLVQAGELENLTRRLDGLADFVEAHVALDRLIALARPTRAGVSSAMGALTPPGQRIALAKDAAFSFFYPHVAQAWRRAGAEIVPFSPLADEAPPEAADICWLPGGYPELHAGLLAGNRRFLDGVRAFAATKPVHGECGGYMVLGEALEDAGGTTHRMAGLIGLETSFAKRRMALGYREARLIADTRLGPRGALWRGHEFHYASVSAAGADPALFEVADARGTALGSAGHRRGHVTGSFFHLIDMNG